MVTSVNNNTSTTTSSADRAAQTLSSDYENFLKLLTTQLQNQDPTEPADTNQLTQQIAALSQVEQQIATNKNLEQLIAMYNSTQLGGAVSYIGKQVDLVGDEGALAGDYASFAYELPEAAASASVTITDTKGGVVFAGSGTTFAGRNAVYWDGVNSFTGQEMPEGTYKIKVTAKDADGNELEAKTLTTGIVTAVNTQNGVTSLMLGDILVPAEDVLSVRVPGA